MTVTPIMGLIAGAVGAGYLVIALFFLKFWSRARDGLFLAFAVAFVLMALTQLLPILLGLPRESQAGVYLFRLAAFVLIIAAIFRKNIAARHDSGRSRDGG